MNSTYPIEDGSPALHGDALEDGKHSEADIVEGRDASIWSFPLFQASALLVSTYIRAVRGERLIVGVAWRSTLAIRKYFIWLKRKFIY